MSEPALAPRSRRAPLLALVLLGHLGLLAWLDASWHRTRPAAPPEAEIELRLIAPPRPPRPVQEAARVAHAPPLAPVAVALPTAPAALPAAPAVATLSLPAAPAPAASAAPRLNLQLSTRSTDAATRMLEQVHNDPRSHSAPLGVEYRIADAAGTLPTEIVDSTDGSGGKLVRQGSKCTRVTPARIGTLNPMDARATSLPSVSGDCHH